MNVFILLRHSLMVFLTLVRFRFCCCLFSFGLNPQILTHIQIVIAFSSIFKRVSEMIDSFCALADDYDDDDGSEIQTEKLLYWSRYCLINHFKTIEYRKLPKHTHTNTHTHIYFILMQREDD